MAPKLPVASPLSWYNRKSYKLNHANSLYIIIGTCCYSGARKEKLG